MSGTDLMISLLGIIITLSVAYNFYNIWRSDNRINELDKTIKTIENEVKKNVKDLDYRTRKNQLTAELIQRDFNVTNDYRTNNWLEGLKHEFEIIAFLCINFEYFKDDFQGKIGMKRSSVSAILLNIHNTFDEKTLHHYGHGNFRDCFRTVTRMWDMVYYSNAYEAIKKYESSIFEDLSIIAETLFKQIENKDFPLHLPDGTKEKLEQYKNKFGN